MTVQLCDLKVGDRYILEDGAYYQVLDVVKERAVRYKSINHHEEESEVIFTSHFLTVSRLNSGQTMVVDAETGNVYQDGEIQVTQPLQVEKSNVGVE